MHNSREYNNEKRKRVYSTDDDSMTSSALSPGFKLSPASYSSPSNTLSPSDSGVTSDFSNSDGGYTPESEFDMPTNGVYAVYAPVLGNIEDIIMDEDQIPIECPPEDEDWAMQMIGLPSGNAESVWGHQKIEETAMSVQIDQTLNSDTVPTTNENDLFSLLETYDNDDSQQTSETSTIEFVSDFSNLDMMMSQRDPMLSHGNMTMVRDVELRTPVVLKPRICSDSTNNMEEIKKPIDGEITKSKMVEERKEIKRVNKKRKMSKPEPENYLLENLPIFVIIFMAILVIFNLIAQATVELPPFAVTGLAMASAISVIFVKKRI